MNYDHNPGNATVGCVHRPCESGKISHVGRHPAQRPQLSGDQLSSNFRFQGKNMYTNY